MYFKHLSNICQIFFLWMFLYAINIESGPSFIKALSNLFQTFVKSLSNHCQIQILFPWMFLYEIIFQKHSPPAVCRRKTSELRFTCKHSDQLPTPEWNSKGIHDSLCTIKVTFMFSYPINWSHCHWNVIFSGILRRFGGWLLRNRACLIFHKIIHFNISRSHPKNWNQRVLQHF